MGAVGVYPMTWAIPLAMVLIAVAVFAIAAYMVERPPGTDWGKVIGSLPTAPWDGQTFEHPGYSYPFYAHGRHRRLE